MRNIRAEKIDEKIQQGIGNVRVCMPEFSAFQSQKTRAERNKHRQLEQVKSRKFVIDTGRANYR